MQRKYFSIQVQLSIACHLQKYNILPVNDMYTQSFNSGYTPFDLPMTVNVQRRRMWSNTLMTCLQCYGQSTQLVVNIFCVHLNQFLCRLSLPSRTSCHGLKCRRRRASNPYIYVQCCGSLLCFISLPSLARCQQCEGRSIWSCVLIRDKCL